MPKIGDEFPSYLRGRYFDRQGKLFTDLLEWGRRFEDPAYKQVAEATLADGTWVSTVWLGLNHNWGAGPPLIFETMVFASSGGPLNELETARYATEAQALVGHKRIVRKWKAKAARVAAKARKRAEVLREVDARTRPLGRRLLSLEG